jgi:hypothetical protein
VCRGGFLAADVAGAAGCGGGDGVVGAGAGRMAGAEVGSGVMMLTAGVDAADGKSALVGLPVGTDGGSAATDAGVEASGMFQDGA